MGVRILTVGSDFYQSLSANSIIALSPGWICEIHRDRLQSMRLWLNLSVPDQSASCEEVLAVF